MTLESLNDPNAWLRAVDALHIGEGAGYTPPDVAVYVPEQSGQVEREVAARPPYEPRYELSHNPFCRRYMDFT